MNPIFILHPLGSILNIMQTFHVHFLLKDALQGLTESRLLFNTMSPFIKDLSLTTNESPFTISSFKDVHKLGCSILSD